MNRRSSCGSTVAAPASPRNTSDYAALLASAFGNQEPLGARQIVRIDIDLVQTSCGYGVPLFEYMGERDTLHRWAENKGDAGLEEYRRQKNARSSTDCRPALPKRIPRQSP